MRRGIIQVFIANIVFLLISLGTNLVLPKYLSVDSYSIFKTYVLYVGYAGFFHFGYNDGMYLKYGGKDLKNIDEKDFARNFYNYFALELIVSFLIFIVGWIINDKIVVAFGFGLLSTNVIGYFKSFYQSIGEFKLYGASLNIEKIVLLLVYVTLIFFVKTDNSTTYIWAQIVIDFAIAVFLAIYLHRRYKYLDKFQLSGKEIVDNIKSGFVLMLGNFANTMFTGIDRWYVKILMSTVEFATYSFSVTMENMINVFVTPISVTMYNDFARNPQIEHVRKVKRMVVLWGPLIVMAAFPCKWFLEHFLTKYIQATSIIFLLFATQIFYVVIKGIYVNYYKVKKEQKRYLFQVLRMTLVSICSNAVLYLLFQSITAIAAATLFTAFVWFCECEYKDKDLRYSAKEIIGILLCIALYLISGMIFNSIFGLIVYALGFGIIVFLCFKENCILCFTCILKSV